MSWIEEKYINMLSPQLENYRVKERSPFKANFRCPYCGDSKKSKTKARGNVYTRAGRCFFLCFNCGKSTTSEKLIEFVNPDLYRDYLFESYKEGASTWKPAEREVEYKGKTPEFEETESSVIDGLMDRVSKLSEDHEAVEYLKNRCVPAELFSEFYYIDNIEKVEQLSEKYRDKIVGREPRIGLPYRDRQGRLVGFTFRSIREKDRIRYLEIKIKDDARLIYNLDRVNLTQNIYVVEGPIDSLFLKNSVAVGTSNLVKLVKGYLPLDKCVFIFDNQPRNKDIVKMVNKAVVNGYKTMIWPKGFEGKDINDLVKDNIVPHSEIMDFIDRNTYEGLELSIKFNEWKKCDSLN